MRRTKYRPRKGTKPRWSVNRQGPNKEGMQTLFGSSSPNRQPHVREKGDDHIHRAWQETPTTKISPLDLERARETTTIQRYNDAGEVEVIDPIPPLVRVLSAIEEVKDRPYVRSYSVYKTTDYNVYLVYTKDRAFFVKVFRDRRERTITYSSQSRALTVWNTTKCRGQWVALN